MDFAWLNRLGAVWLGLSFVGLMVAGAFAGARRARTRTAASSRSAPALESALLGLLGLLLAFTFSGAAARFDARGQLMLDTASAIRAVALRTDLFPAETRSALRRDLADYVAEQATFYRAERDEQELQASVERLDQIERRLWSQVVASLKDPSTAQAGNALLGVLDRMFALSLSRRVAAQNHMPAVVVLLLFVIAAATAYVSGNAAAHAGSFHPPSHVLFAALTSLVVYVTLDLDRPGRGIIRRDLQQHTIDAIAKTLAN
jgi:hypothetical protein